MKWKMSALLVAVLGCPGASPPPGDEHMGRYSFRAEPMPLEDGGGCDFAEVPDGGFSFDAEFSRFKDAGLYFTTIGGIPQKAVWDGQRLSATYSAQRNFSQCQCANASPVVVKMTETLTATIVSRSQSEAAMGCVDAPPVDVDAGVVPPDTTAEGGFDAVRACGTLEEFVKADSTVPCRASCNGCMLRYRIQGERR